LEAEDLVKWFVKQQSGVFSRQKLKDDNGYYGDDKSTDDTDKRFKRFLKEYENRIAYENRRFRSRKCRKTCRCCCGCCFDLISHLVKTFQMLWKWMKFKENLTRNNRREGNMDEVDPATVNRSAPHEVPLPSSSSGSSVYENSADSHEPSDEKNLYAKGKEEAHAEEEEEEESSSMDLT
jgi:hypothetical protein